MTEKSDGKESSQREVQHKIGETRDSLRTTVEAIEDKAEHQYDKLKQTVAHVLDYRDEFQKEPVVLSLGALSAGVALGYTLGYFHKVAKGKKGSQVARFMDSVVEELSNVGQRLVLPELNAKIAELFGFDFNGLLQQIRGKKTTRHRPRHQKKAHTRKPSGTRRRR